MTNLTIEATQSGGFQLDPDTYDATVEDIAPEDGQFGPQYKFVYKLDDQFKDDGENIRMWEWCSQKLTPKSKLWARYTAIMGTLPELGTRVDLEPLIGQPCRVFINNVEVDGQERSRVTDVLAPKAKAPAGRKPAPATVKNEAAGLCGFPKCGRPAVQYDDDGTGLCAKHGGVE